jgi:hypothetical protein
MRHDLQSYAPQTGQNNLLMCCTCGRFLPPENFSLEHIIPQQALADDPKEIKANRQTTTNIRSGNILLCNKPILIKGLKTTNNGCNGWKGRCYDGLTREVLNGNITSHGHKTFTNNYIIALICTAYLGMVMKFGYQVALMASGRLMREQFFLPLRFHQNLPLRSQLILTGQMPEYDENNLDIWKNPFKFTIETDSCYVAMRSVSLIIPISHDLRLPLSKSILITPRKYKLRPDFQTFFD